jgi:hypothetical protein
VCLEVISLPFCLLKVGLLFEPGFLPIWWAGLPIDSWAFSRLLCATKTHSPVCWERHIAPVDQNTSTSTLWDGYPHELWMPSASDKKVKTPSLNPGLSPQKCCWIFKQRNGTPRLFWKQYLLACQRDSQIPIQRLSPENKRVLPYIPLQAGYRSKKQGLTHIWLYTSLLVTSLSVLPDLPQVQIL